jgi:hypothetical protein
MQPGNLGKPLGKPESRMSMRDRMIEDALRFYEIDDKTLNPVNMIQVNIPETTTHIMNRAWMLFTQMIHGSTRDDLITEYNKLWRLHNTKYIHCWSNPHL